VLTENRVGFRKVPRLFPQERFRSPNDNHTVGSCCHNQGCTATRTRLWGLVIVFRLIILVLLGTAGRLSIYISDSLRYLTVRVTPSYIRQDDINIVGRRLRGSRPLSMSKGVRSK
jgi:hypothetical protein